MPKPLAPCGTIAAYKRHLAHHEAACEECKIAHRLYKAAYRAAHPNQSTRELMPCGTRAAARRHWRRGEPLDDACRRASRREAAERMGHAANTDEPDYREIRNGLPFRPYVYRGTGYDQLEGPRPC